MSSENVAIAPAQDVEKGAAKKEQDERMVMDVGVMDEGLERQLKARHIQMISIGGVIGTGLFLGTANALRHGGPLGMWLGYSIMGTIVFSVMVCLGEMISHLPITGGFITLGHRFVDPAFSFLQAAELSAAAVLISYWDDSVNPAVWITMCLVVAVGINLGGTRVYGEMEFWFAIIKVLTITGLIILGIVLTAGGGPDHKAIGFRYWRNPGPFVQYLGIAGAKGRFLGFWAVLIQASYSYLGTEIVAIAAGEAKNPKKTLPKAIKSVYFRILFFYVAGTFIVGLLVSSKDSRLALGTGTAVSSPFVIAINNSGIKVLPGIINACLLTSAWSAASSDLYTSSRALYGLAINGNAPRVFAKTTNWGLPWVAVIANVAIALLAYLSAGDASASTAFTWFSNMTSVCGLAGWAGICWTYIRFYNGLKVQGIDRSELPYRAPLQPYLSYYAMIFCLIILFFNGFAVFIHYNPATFDQSTFWTSYVPIIMCPILYFGYRFYYKVTTIPYVEMDFVSGSREGEDEEEEEQSSNFIVRAWRAIM
ncbi:amino acid transmembrane transporter [Pseudohyphozyma bogoriensis]|nr:amino acid transmembrane transporter [Pseudohyphozyma bogoriensis]